MISKKKYDNTTSDNSDEGADDFLIKAKSDVHNNNSDNNIDINTNKTCQFYESVLESSNKQNDTCKHPILASRMLPTTIIITI